MPANTAVQDAPSSGSKLPPITLALFFLPFLASRRIRKGGRTMSQIFTLLSLALISVSALLAGCGGHSGGTSTLHKSYTLTVTATSGNIQQSTTIMLDLQ